MGAALALVVGGAALMVVASTLPAARVRPARTAVPVNPGAREGTDVRAHNSPSLARNPLEPSNLVLADRVDTPGYSCALHVSGDGGATWQESAIPFPAGEERPERCFAPDATFGADGTLYLVFVTLAGRGNSPNAVWVATSSDGGRTLGEPVRALGRYAFQARLLADATRPGRLYLTWLQADAVALVAFPNPANPVSFMRSDDGGRTWTAPVAVSTEARRRVVAPSLAQGGDALYVVYLELLDDRLDYHGAHEWRGGEPYGGPWRIVLARSSDGGATWTDVDVERDLVPTQRVLVFLPPAPSLAVAPGGRRIHVTFMDGRGGDADVMLWTSEDAGRTFRAPRRVNDTPPKDGTSQYLPKVAVTPGGRVDVAYYDRRGDAEDVMNEVSLQSSFDGGDTFTGRAVVSSRPFDSRIGFGGRRGMPDLGSRLGLLSDNDGALVAWTDTRRGTPLAVRQDVAVAAVAVSEPSPWRRRLPPVGAVLIAGGLACGLLALWRGRRPGEPGNGRPGRQGRRLDGREPQVGVGIGRSSVILFTGHRSERDETWVWDAGVWSRLPCVPQCWRSRRRHGHACPAATIPP